MRVLKHPICFISLFNPFLHVMMSDSNLAGNFGLTSGYYIHWNSLLSYTYMAILLPYMVRGGGGRGPPSLIHENVCHVCNFISATPLPLTIYGGTKEDAWVSIKPVRSLLQLDMECQSQCELRSPIMKGTVCYSIWSRLICHLLLRCIRILPLISIVMGHVVL